MSTPSALNGSARPLPVSSMPCHHGCNCRLQEMVDSTATSGRPASPEVLDLGEMRALFTGVREADEYLLGVGEYLGRQRDAVSATHEKARTALARLGRLAASGTLGEASSEVRRLRRSADAAGGRQKTALWLRMAAAGVILGLAVFDAAYFVGVFQNLLRIPVGAPAVYRYIGFLPGFILPIGLFLVGRILTGPILLFAARWSREPTADDPQPRWWRRLPWWLALLAFPALLLVTIALWAYIRAGRGIPVPGMVMLLLLTLAVVAVAFEVAVHRPEAEKLGRAIRHLRRVQRSFGRELRQADKMLGTHDTAWRRLRSSRDEALSRARVQLGMAWESLILSARMRHAQAGALPPTLRSVATGPDARPPDVTDVAEAERLFQFFDHVNQPVLGLGPLAEVFRTVRDLDPAHLNGERDQLKKELEKQLAGPASKGDDS